MSLDKVAASATIAMRLTRISYAAERVHLYEFRPVSGAPVPRFTAGAHVDLHLPNGLVRQYSIANAEEQGDRYVLGVKRETAGRGGSRFMHDELRVGAVLAVGGPRNNFPLVEAAAHSVLIAGGIGVTPIVSMVARLRSLGRSGNYTMRSGDGGKRRFSTSFEPAMDLCVSISTRSRVVCSMWRESSAPRRGMRIFIVAALRRCSKPSRSPARRGLRNRYILNISRLPSRLLSSVVSSSNSPARSSVCRSRPARRSSRRCGPAA
jgi:hypothetical protein